MEKDLSNLRLVYERGHLLETEVRENPMEQFQQWFLQAQESESEKEPNPHVCLSFFWSALERQVIIKGVAEKLARNLSEGYFESRPRGSQLGSMSSAQSQVVPSRVYLEEQLAALEKEYEGKSLKCPEHWGGFLVRPHSLEFWQGRPNRLHDRLRYTLKEDYDWKIERLAP